MVDVQQVHKHSPISSSALPSSPWRMADGAPMHVEVSARHALRSVQQLDDLVLCRTYVVEGRAYVMCDEGKGVSGKGRIQRGEGRRSDASHALRPVQQLDELFLCSKGEGLINLHPHLPHTPGRARCLTAGVR